MDFQASPRGGAEADFETRREIYTASQHLCGFVVIATFMRHRNIYAVS
jgi:hypothetical protein